MLLPNMRVRIHAADGDATGEVVEVRRADELWDALPDTPGDMIEMAREDLARRNVARVAMILHGENPGTMFAALEIAGEWYDLQGQHLEFEIIAHPVV